MRDATGQDEGDKVKERYGFNVLYFYVRFIKIKCFTLGSCEEYVTGL